MKSYNLEIQFLVGERNIVNFLCNYSKIVLIQFQRSESSNLKLESENFNLANTSQFLSLAHHPSGADALQVACYLLHFHHYTIE